MKIFWVLCVILLVGSFVPLVSPKKKGGPMIIITGCGGGGKGKMMSYPMDYDRKRRR
jgi:hypothetical protein